MTSPNDIEIEIIYQGQVDNELNAQLDGLAETHGGRFGTFVEIKRKSICNRTYFFAEDGYLDEFFERANFLISKHFGFEAGDINDFPKHTRWSLNEALYHHIEFLELKDAKNFASALRGTFATYANDDMFDIFILQDVSEEEPSFYVIYGFPAESLITVMSEEESEDGDDEELFSASGASKDDKNKLN